MTRQRGRRRVSALALAAIAGAGALAGCSSDGGADGSESATAAGAGSTGAASTNAQIACNRLYALDLFRNSTARDAVSMDGKGKSQALKDYRDLSSSLVSAVSGAVTIGALPPSTQTSAQRIDRALAKIAKAGGNISDAVGAADARIARRSTRIETACIAANVPVPQENLDARSAADEG